MQWQCEGRRGSSKQRGGARQRTRRRPPAPVQAKKTKYSPGDRQKSVCFCIDQSYTIWIRRSSLDLNRFTQASCKVSIVCEQQYDKKIIHQTNF